MKLTSILVIILIGLLATSTIIIISIKENIPILNKKKIFEENKVNDLENNLTGDEENPVSSFGTAGGSGSSTEDSTREIICKMEYIQYSLKNFKEEIRCVENSTGTCTILNSTCSVYIYNIDTNVTENFEFKYSMIDSQENELDSVNTIINVNTTKAENIKSNFIIQNENGIDENSKCKLEVITVPRKETCY